MTYTRRIKWECEQEYDSLEEAQKDEDNLLKKTQPNDFDNAELFENILEDETGCVVCEDYPEEAGQ